MNRKHIIDDACVKSYMLDKGRNCANIQQHSRHAQNLPTACVLQDCEDQEKKCSTLWLLIQIQISN